MKKRIVLISLVVMLLCGCDYECPKIIENGPTTWTTDDVNINVPDAKPGLKAYDITRTDEGIDVILHYDKKE